MDRLEGPRCYLASETRCRCPGVVLLRHDGDPETDKRSRDRHSTRAREHRAIRGARHLDPSLKSNCTCSLAADGTDAFEAKSTCVSMDRITMTNPVAHRLPFCVPGSSRPNKIRSAGRRRSSGSSAVLVAGFRGGVLSDSNWAGIRTSMRSAGLPGSFDSGLVPHRTSSSG